MHEPHTYARDPRSAAGTCVCGGALRDIRHLLAAPGVPIPNQIPAEELGRVLLALVCLHIHGAAAGLSSVDVDEVIAAWSTDTDTDEPWNYTEARAEMLRRARRRVSRPEQPVGQSALPERAEAARPSTPVRRRRYGSRS